MSTYIHTLKSTYLDTSIHFILWTFFFFLNEQYARTIYACSFIMQRISRGHYLLWSLSIIFIHITTKRKKKKKAGLANPPVKKISEIPYERTYFWMSIFRAYTSHVHVRSTPYFSKLSSIANLLNDIPYSIHPNLYNLSTSWEWKNQNNTIE